MVGVNRMTIMKKTITEYLNDEVRAFSTYANVRTIPSVVDSFKPGQRKAIYTLLRRGESSGEVKVSSLSGEVITHAAYHHGNVSLENTIITLSQNFSGSNNYNLLEPIGQFGTRLNKDASAARYIFTKLSKYFRMFYKKEDELLLVQKDEDGDLIEPENYFPIVPTVLLNGVSGVGTGFATMIMSYKASDVIDNCVAVLNGKKQKSLIPWVRDFTGTINREPSGSIVMTGVLTVTGVYSLKITEIPTDYDLESYKGVLNKLEDAGVIREYDDLSSGNRFEFVVKINREVSQLPMDKLLEKFKLISKFSENYTLFNENNKIKVFQNPNEIVEYFVKLRLIKYAERIAALIKYKEEDLVWKNEKIKFIKYWLKNSNSLTKLTKSELYDNLKNAGFISIDDLLGNKIYNLTKEEVDKLENQIIEVTNEIVELKNTKPNELYIKELQILKKELKE
jgi:DNA topoisomerase-2